MLVEPGDLIFATTNEHKFAEAKVIAEMYGLRVVRVPVPVVDIQSANVVEIAEEKARSCYLQLLRPLFVDQTSLHIDGLGGFPAGYTEYFMDRFGDDRIAQLFGTDDLRHAEGQTTLVYCNGRTIRTFTATIQGDIVDAPRGGTSGWDGFGWNRVFIPEGEGLTFAEMGVARKNEISMRRAALKQLFEWVAAHGGR